ncbi:MAG: hypothetical protein ACEPOV_06020 [Hyphomicrobiales bacterium]
MDLSRAIRLLLITVLVLTGYNYFIAELTIKESVPVGMLIILAIFIIVNNIKKIQEERNKRKEL